MTSYVYRLTFLITGQLYIGSRKCKTDPWSDLWKKYFSSSKVVKALINEHGLNSFSFEIIREFVTYADALSYESELLESVNADKDNRYLNQSIPGKTFRSKVRTIETRNKISNTLKGRANPRKGLPGVPCSEEKRAKLAITSKIGYAKRNPSNKDNWANIMSAELPVIWHNKKTNEYFYGNRRSLKLHDPSVSITHLGWILKGKENSHKGWSPTTNYDVVLEL